MIVNHLFENRTAINTAQTIARELHATLMDLINIGQAQSQQGAGHPEYAAKLRQEAIALARDLEQLGYEFDFKSPGYIRAMTVDNQPQTKISEMRCMECGGPAFSDLILAEKKDACYYKVKASAKVWPSAYASGRLVQCRKKGAKNYGNKSKNEDATDTDQSRQPVRPNTPPQPIKKKPATPFGPGSGVAEGHADQQRKIFKQNGKPVGEVGVDRESSPGVGQYYIKHYASGTDLSGYNSREEAVEELRHLVKQGVAEGWWKDFKVGLKSESQAFYVVPKFIDLQIQSLIKHNDPDPRFWNMLKKDIADLPDDVQHLLSDLLNDVDLEISHWPRGFFGHSQNNDVQRTKNLISLLKKIKEIVEFNDSTNKKQGVAEGIEGEIAGGAVGSLVGGAAGSSLGPIGKVVGSAVGGSVGGAIGSRYQDGKPLKEKQQLDEIAPLLAAGARLFVAAAPKIAQIVGKVGRAGAQSAGQAAKAGAEIAAKNAGQIGIGVGAYEIGSSVADIAKEITAKVGTAIDQKTVLELSTLAFKYAIPAAIVLAILYGGKKAIDSLFSNASSQQQGVAEGLESLESFDRGVIDYMQDNSWLSAERAYFRMIGIQKKKNTRRDEYDQMIQRYIDLYDKYKGPQGVAEGLNEFAPPGNGDGDDNGDSEMQRRLIMLKSLVHLQQDLDPASIQVWYVSRTDIYYASGQRPGEAVTRLFKYTYNPQSKKFVKVPGTPGAVTSESLADDFADFARQRGIKVRVAGTPEQERERSRALQAERAKAHEQAQRERALADRQQLDDLESKFADMKARYDSLGGSAWQYADREQNLTASEREARSMESDLNTLYARIQRAKQVDDLNEGPVTDNAVKLIKGLGLAGMKGVQGLWWAVNNPGKALTLAAVTAYPKETWNAANFSWNLVTDPGHVTAVLGRRAAADMPMVGKWVDKAQAARDLEKIMGNTATSDMIFRLAGLAVDNALPIAGVIALLYGGTKFVQYLRDRNAIPAGEKAFQRISQELGGDRLPKPNSGPTEPPVSEADVKDQFQPMKLADYLAQAEALQAKLSRAARDNDREVIQKLEQQRSQLDAQARRGLVPEGKKSDDLVGGRHSQDQFDAMVGRLRQLANAGPLKTVWDPQRQVYRNVPINPKQDKK